MGRLTHASWSILDEELDSHGYFNCEAKLSFLTYKGPPVARQMAGRAEPSLAFEP